MAKVLLIDDDTDLVEINKAVLTGKGHDVVVAYSAKEGREKFDTEAPDLVVLDVMMETESAGFNLAREIHEAKPQLPILMLTGVREAMDMPFKYEPDETYLPVVEVLEKPFDAAVLTEKVEKLLGA